MESAAEHRAAAPWPRSNRLQGRVKAGALGDAESDGTPLQNLDLLVVGEGLAREHPELLQVLGDVVGGEVSAVVEARSLPAKILFPASTSQLRLEGRAQN